MSLSFKDKLAMFRGNKQNSSKSNIPKNTPNKQPNTNKTQKPNEAKNFNQIKKHPKLKMEIPKFKQDRIQEI